MEPTPIPQPPPDVKPLSKRTKSGYLYKREVHVEAQIRTALTLQPDELLHCADLTEKEASGYLQEESLVYLIRAYYEIGNRMVVESLFKVLISRCHKFVENNFSHFDPVVAEDGCQDVWTMLVDRILHANDGRGDYYEVRFWDGLYKIILSVKWRLINSTRREKEWIPLSNLAGQELENPEDGSEESDNRATKEIPSPLSVEQTVLLNEGLNQLPEPTRTIFWLYYFDGWQIDSNDPQEPTLSKLYQRTPRMIKYRLQEAKQILEEWRGKEHE